MSRNGNKRIYEIVRACRLCGVAAGDMIPIIQDMFDPDSDDEDIDLVPKIMESLQIEIVKNDGMPPLICVGCSIKVEDFHEFRKQCRERNMKTRAQLCLPPQNTQAHIPANTNLTPTIYINNSDSDGEPLAKQQSVKARPKPKSLKSREVRSVEVGVQTCPEAEGKKTRQYSDDIIIHQIQDMNLLELRPEPKYLSKNDRRKFRRQEREQRLEMDRIKESQTETQSDTREGIMSSRAKRLRDSSLELSTPPTNKKAKVNEALNPIPKVFEFECTSCCMLARTASQLAQHVVMCAANKKEIEAASIANKTSKTDSKTRPGTKVTKQEPKPEAKSSKPGPKTSKAGPKSSRLDPDTPKAGLKSRSDFETAKPGPKSSKSVLENTKPEKSRPDLETLKLGPKSKLAELLKQGPTSSKLEPKPRTKWSEKSVKSKPGAKNNTENLSSNGKHQDDVPWKETETAVSDKVKNNKMLVSLLEDKQKEMCSVVDKKPVNKKVSISNSSKYCGICDQVCRNAQSLGRHNAAKHGISTTPYECACNPCELWFPTEDEAILHHTEHTSNNTPYTCNKCYGDFNDIHSYDRHFGLNQCLSTYEVPDVRCDECWATFPTDRLLEGHRCAGQGARPGGKCSKCDKKYSLLRNQIIHEMKCKGRKKEERVETSILSQMLPMQVRLVRCDDLLKHTHGLYDVSNISHTFGLDRNYSYPYFYSKDVKTKPPRDYITPTREDNEFKPQGFVNWDSEDENNDTYIESSPKTIEALSTLSIKTLFSPKCLGKVPRRIKSSNLFDSILSIKFSDDIRRNIDSIISNLTEETQGDSHSDSVVPEIINSDSGDVTKTNVNGEDSSETLNEELDRVSSENNGNVELNSNKEQSTLNETLDSNINGNNSTSNRNDDENSAIESKVDFIEENGRSEVDSNRTSIEDPDIKMDNSDNIETCTVEKNDEDSLPQTEVRPDGDEKVINRQADIVNDEEKLSQNQLQVERTEEMEVDPEAVDISNSVHNSELTKSVEEEAENDENITSECNGNEYEEENLKEESNDVLENNKKENFGDNNTKIDIFQPWTSTAGHNNIKINNDSENSNDINEPKNNQSFEPTSEVTNPTENVQPDSNFTKEANYNETIGNDAETPNYVMSDQNSLHNDFIKTEEKDMEHHVLNGDTPRLNSIRDDGKGSHVADNLSKSMDDYTDEQLMAEINAQLGETEHSETASENTNNLNNQNDDENISKKQQTLIETMKKRDDDMKSLELDNISDDEFNFDI